MRDGHGPAVSKGQRKYERLLRRRLQVASAATWLRAGGIQAVWLVILLAGAAIPLTEALITSGWTWVSPVLGFVVVVAAGLERIFGRTTEAAVARDVLRRDLNRERRLLMAGSGAYANAEDPMALYALRAEEQIGIYDKRMIDYSTDVLRADP